MSLVDHDLQGHLSDGFIAYRMYLAIRQHFNPSNQYVYNSLRNKKSPNYTLVKCSKESFQRKKNAIYFARLTKQFHGNLHRIEDYIVANLLKDPFWGTGEWLVDDSSEATYKEWLRRVESLSYQYEKDNKHLRNRCKSLYTETKQSESVEGRTSIGADNETMSAGVADCSPNTLDLNSVYFKLCVLAKTGTHPLIVRELLGARICVETLSIFCKLSGCHKEWDHTDPSIAAAVPRLMAYESLLDWDRTKCMDIMRSVWHPPTKNQ